MSKMILNTRDKSGESSGIALNFADVAAGGANFDAVLAQQLAVFNEIDTISLAVLSRNQFAQEVSADVATPTNNAAQREFGLRIHLVDLTANRRSFFTIPAPDLVSMTIPANTDIVPLTETLVAALIVDVEAGVLSADGNAVTVEKVVIVGRRN